MCAGQARRLSCNCTQRRRRGAPASLGTVNSHSSFAEERASRAERTHKYIILAARDLIPSIFGCVRRVTSQEVSAFAIMMRLAIGARVGSVVAQPIMQKANRLVPRASGSSVNEIPPAHSGEEATVFFAGKAFTESEVLICRTCMWGLIPSVAQ